MAPGDNLFFSFMLFSIWMKENNSVAKKSVICLTNKSSQNTDMSLTSRQVKEDLGALTENDKLSFHDPNKRLL